MASLNISSLKTLAKIIQEDFKYWFPWLGRFSPLLLSISFLMLFLIAVFVTGPWEEAVHSEYIENYSPELASIVRLTLDQIAGQVVCLPVLIITAFFCWKKRRSWTPWFTVIAAEGAFLSTGFFKLVTARNAPTLYEGPDFWNGGFLEHTFWGMSFPSGHAVEAVLIYGAAIFLLLRYDFVQPKLRRFLFGCWGFIVALAVTVSFLLGYHWLTDLLAGLVYGLLMLQLVVSLSMHGPRFIDQAHSALVSSKIRQRLRNP